MRTELIDINDITDSRELMAKKAPHGISAFIAIVSVLLIVALVWASFGKLDNYAKMMGEIRPADEVSTLSTLNGGVIKNIYFKDGSDVKAGDILFEFDTDYYVEQKDLLVGQIAEIEKNIANNEKLIQSIKTDKNLFDKERESVFYYQYENYQIELKTTLEQLSNSNGQVLSSIAEVDQAISNASQNLAEARKLQEEYRALYEAIEKDGVYAGENKTVMNMYQSYVLSLEKTQGVSVEVLNIKNTTLGNIDSILQDLKQQIATQEGNLNTYKAKKQALAVDNSAAMTKEKLKNSYYISINNTIDGLRQNLQSLKTQKAEAEEALSNASVKAMQDGTLILSQEYSAGDMVSAGEVIATIIPKEEDYTVTLYVPEQNIASVKVGQKVEYVFSAISATDYGKVYGKIVSISADSFADQESGAKFYRAEATIEKMQLTNKQGETANLKVGMLTEAHAITGTQSVLTWLLDKLSFI